MRNILHEFYRLPESWVRFESIGGSCAEDGYFRLGNDLVLYGQCLQGQVSSGVENDLFDAQHLVQIGDRKVSLPFDPLTTAENLLYERYCSGIDSAMGGSLARSISRALYYSVRPLLGVGVRRHLQKRFFRDWQRLRFPRWPVDTTVESFHEQLLRMAGKATREEKVPFVWFWPQGASACMIMTHDVETEVGRDFCSTIMDLDDQHGIKASFQVVPERRYGVAESYLESIRSRGHEVNVQDLNHDGLLFDDQQEFKRRARRINKYVRDFGARGFRAAVLYRRQNWFDALDVSYDMSVPNVAHLDPQRGGCCTVMPYFIGKILELPATTTQDYQLFHILGERTLELWQRQVELILAKHGLITFIIHPDYVIDLDHRSVFRALLQYLSELCISRNIWKALPREVDEWWRNRSQMRLFQEGESWRVEGPDSARARVAYASFDEDRIQFSIAPQSA